MACGPERSPKRLHAGPCESTVLLLVLIGGAGIMGVKTEPVSEQLGLVQRADFCNALQLKSLKLFHPLRVLRASVVKVEG